MVSGIFKSHCTDGRVRHTEQVINKDAKQNRDQDRERERERDR